MENHSLSLLTPNFPTPNSPHTYPQNEWDIQAEQDLTSFHKSNRVHVCIFDVTTHNPHFEALRFYDAADYDRNVNSGLEARADEPPLKSSPNDEYVTLVQKRGAIYLASYSFSSRILKPLFRGFLGKLCDMRQR